MRMNFNTNICFIDFETTGIDIKEDYPIQLGAFLVNQTLNPLKEFTSFIRLPSNAKISKTAIEIHNIEEKTLLKQPYPKHVIINFFNELGYDYCLAGWNISFDIPFLRIMCSKIGKMADYNKINYRHIDVQSICQIAVRLSLVDSKVKSLDDCVDYFGLERNKKHDAFEDAKITYEVFKNLVSLFENNIIPSHSKTNSVKAKVSIK